MTGRLPIVFWLTALLILTNQAQAYGLGLGPGISNVVLGRGEQKELTFTAMTNSETPVQCSISKSGEIEGWIEIYQNTIQIQPKSQKEFKILVRVPKNIPNGGYSGIVKITDRSISNFDGTVGMGVIQSIASIITINVNGTERGSYSATTVRAPSSIKKGENFSVEVTVRNDGDTWIRPTTEILLLDSNMIDVYNTAFNSTSIIHPASEEIIDYTVPTDKLMGGEYFIHINTTWHSEQLLSQMLKLKVITENQTYEVFSGQLMSLNFDKREMKPGESSTIKSEFMNSGNNTVNATMMVKIRRDQNYEEVKSGPQNVEPGGKAEFTATYTPKTYGYYEAEGYFEYANTRTDSRKFAFVVMTEGSPQEAGSTIKKDAMKYIQVGALLTLTAAICLVVWYKKSRSNRG